MKALKKYVKKREDVISLILDKPKGLYTPQTFHKLRVEIKKLNASFDLINYCARDFQRKKTIKPFNGIFKRAGKVRDIQIEEALLKKYLAGKKLKTYRRNLMKQSTKEKAIFFSIINKRFITQLKKTYGKIYPFISQVNKKKIDKYLDKKQVAIDKIRNQKRLKISDLHTLRKRLKALQYNWNSLDLAYKNDVFQKNTALLELLGKWHDYYVVICHLKNVIHKDGLDPGERNQLGKARTALKFKSIGLVKRINQVLA